MTDLRVSFCGIDLPNPFILASAPPTGTCEMIARGFEAGWGGAVTKTIGLHSEKVKNVTPRITSLCFSSFEGEPKKVYAIGNIELISDRPFSVWIDEIKELRKQYPDRCIIVSIMADGNNKDEWVEIAKSAQEAQASALELNFSCPHKGMAGEAVGRAIGQDPVISARITSWVKQVVNIPVLVKLTPNVTDVVQIGKAVRSAGADGLTAINSVAAIPGVDLDTFAPIPAVFGRGAQGGLGGPAIKPIALRIVSELARDVGLPISGVGGISTWKDAAEFALLGASTFQVGTAVMFNGYGIIEDLCEGLRAWMEDKGFSKISDFVGLANKNILDIMELDRSVRLVSSINRDRCVKCDICFVCCRDGGYQAITVPEDRIPIVDQSKCSGCGLCVQACPVWDCITLRKA